MKRIVLITLALVPMIIGFLPCPARAQGAAPDGITVQLGNFRSWLKAADLSWTRESAMNDTIPVTSAIWTRLFGAPEGNLNIEYTSILTAGTDSMKIILFKTNHSQSNFDSLKITKLDSVKILAAGFCGTTGGWVPNCNGKWGPNLGLKIVPIGATRTGKLTDVSVGVQ